MHLVREKSLHEGLEPEAVGVDSVPVPAFKGEFHAGEFGIRQVELLWRQCEGGSPGDALLAGYGAALAFDGLLLVERELVLNRPDGPDGVHVATLGTKAE